MSAAIERSVRWAAGVAVAATLIAGVAYMAVSPPAPHIPPVAPLSGPKPARVAIAPEQGAPYPIESLLAVPGRMRYGQSVWDDRGAGGGAVWVRIDRRAQMLSVFRGGDEIGTAVVLYGAPAFQTPAGRYPVLAKMRDHRSSTYNAEMPFTLRLTGDGVSIHAANVSEGRATHGCIGVPEDFAKRLFDTVKVGDPVVIV